MRPGRAGRQGARLVAALLGAALLSACGLPLPQGVRAGVPVPEEAPRGGPVVVLPPGPAPDAGPEEIVTGFLAAQTSAADDYAVAREFLAEGVEWDPSGGLVEVYDRPPDVVAGDVLQEVVVVAERSATVRPDGGYRRADGEVEDAYAVACPEEQCRITALPAQYGLRLSRSGLLGSFAPQEVHFLAPAAERLVADLVWLPRGEALARELVEQVVEVGPSDALEGSVATAVPPGTVVEDVRVSQDGTVDVALSEQARGLDERGREQLSAQLVWTLRGLGDRFAALRLTAGGQPVQVRGSTSAQAATSFAEYAPERLRAAQPHYLADRALHLLDGALPTSDVTTGELPVDAAALAPDGTVAALTVLGEGRVQLTTGPLPGPFTPRLSGALSSPTWGTGESGVWLVQGGRLVRVPRDGEPRTVTVEGLSRFGPVRAVRLARDGVRVALLAGAREDPHLVVGRLVPGADVVSGLREIVPTLEQVVDVAWESGTSLVVLFRQPTTGRFPARVAVDGSGTPVAPTVRLPEGTTLSSVAAAAGQPLVLGGLVGGVERVLVEDGPVFRVVAEGRAPGYPG